MLVLPYMEGQNDLRPTSTTKLTYDDFLRFPGFEADGVRHELIDGEHVVTPSPSERHQNAVLALALALGPYVNATAVGKLYLGPFDVILSQHDIVEPDLLLVLADEQETITQQGVFGAPALVVEVLSPGTRRRDITTKRQLYERAGVREYWIVDPNNQKVTVCRSTAGGALETVEELSRSREDMLTSPMLPGFSVAVGDLFAGSVR